MREAVDQALDPFGIGVAMTKAMRAFRAGKRFEIENCGHHILAPHGLPHPESNSTKMRQLFQTRRLCPDRNLR
jgi:hypothetical protein